MQGRRQAIYWRQRRCDRLCEYLEASLDYLVGIVIVIGVAWIALLANWLIGVRTGEPRKVSEAERHELAQSLAATGSYHLPADCFPTVGDPMLIG